MSDWRAEARKRCEAATAWFTVDDSPCDEAWAEQYPADAIFTAHARTDLPRALDELDATDAALAEARAEVERLRGVIRGMLDETVSTTEAVEALDRERVSGGSES